MVEHDFTLFSCARRQDVDNRVCAVPGGERDNWRLTNKDAECSNLYTSRQVKGDVGRKGPPRTCDRFVQTTVGSRYRNRHIENAFPGHKATFNRELIEDPPSTGAGGRRPITGVKTPASHAGATGSANLVPHLCG